MMIMLMMVMMIFYVPIVMFLCGPWPWAPRGPNAISRMGGLKTELVARLQTCESKLSSQSPAQALHDDDDDHDEDLDDSGGVCDGD
eukprot:2494145-Karenia_brevis.AAC.1